MENYCSNLTRLYWVSVCVVYKVHPCHKVVGGEALVLPNKPSGS